MPGNSTVFNPMDPNTPIRSVWLNDVNNQSYNTMFAAQYLAGPIDSTGTTDASAKLNAALATGHVVYVPNGTYLLNNPLIVPQNGGIVAESQQVSFIRNFTGAPLIQYPGGNPVTLKNFAVLSRAGLVPTTADTGVDLAGSQPWAGRSDIGNLLIIGQYHGLRFTGGGVNPMYNIVATGNKGNGFYGEEGNCILDGCLSSRNVGDGFFYHNATTGQGQPQLRNCTSFANQAFGYNFTAEGAGNFGANVWMYGCVSSFDKITGMLFSGPWTQVFMDSVMIEYAGLISQQDPSIPNFNQAIGLEFAGGASTVKLGKVFVNTSTGIGAVLSQVSGLQADNFEIANSNQGGNPSGGNAVGLNIIGGTNHQYNNLKVPPTGVVTDISISGGASNIDFGNAKFASYINDGTARPIFGPGNTLLGGVPTLASNATLVIPDTQNVFYVSGTTTINGISALSNYVGRTIKLIFTGACTVANTGNVHLPSNFTSTTNATLTLTTDGANWFGK